jgi:hypothetical protein
MSKVTRQEFNSTFEHGIDLDDPDLKSALTSAGLDAAKLAKADLDGDGTIDGRRELRSAFNVVDDLDTDGNRNTFEDAGQAAELFGALKLGRKEAPYHGAAIAQAAADRVVSDGPGYAFGNAPTSPLAQLSGNAVPGTTHPAWLKDNNKCNQFVGDALTQAGVKAPTVTMANGSLHYARAETWPSRADLFDRITDRNDIKVGDVIVRDRPGSGESTAHIEVVTSVSPFKTTGAHATGAYEATGDWLAGTTANAANRSFTDGADELYVLRPKKLIGE